MNIKISIAALAAMIVAAGFSCKKNEFVRSIEERAPSKLELITYYKWRLIAQSEQNGNNAALDLYSLLPPCRQDDYLQFGRQNMVTLFEGATKCQPTDPASVQSNWAFNNDTTIIRFGINLPAWQDYQLNELSPQRLVLERNEIISGINKKTISTYLGFL
jgi:hypothetical protein